MEFSLSPTPLENLDLSEGLSADRSGACVTFGGTVRDRNEGRAVTALEYQAYDKLCRQEMERIFVEARERFPVLHARVIHRTGYLEIGQLAVWIGVIAPHRGEAFDCCRFLIDELKARLPIWKKEHYQDGDSGWIGSPARTDASSAPPADADGWEKDVAGLSADELTQAVWIDVREPYERMLSPLRGVTCLEIPFGDFHFEQRDFQSDRDYLVFCSRGIRSREAVRLLRASGLSNTYSLNNTFGEIKAAVHSQITP